MPPAPSLPRMNNCTDNLTGAQAIAYAASFVGPRDNPFTVINVEPPQLQRRIDVAGANTYVGESLPGTGADVAQWRIKRIPSATTDGQYAGGIFPQAFADNDAGFTKEWDDRATYTYDF